LRGATVYYCTLNVDAVEALRDGDDVKARSLAKAAEQIEAKPISHRLVSAMTAGKDLTALAGNERGAVTHLAAEISRARKRLTSHSPFLGWVVEAEENFVTVDSDETTIVLPREALRIRDLDHPGMPVAIRARQLLSGAMIHSVDKALAIDDDDRRGARPFDPFQMRRERRRQGTTVGIREVLAGHHPSVRLLAPLALAD
jgi:hypothetical protein